MIIEFFGPPAAGKTTIAQILTRQLRDAGHVVEPIISNRPAEWDDAQGERVTSAAFPILIRRLARPIIQAGAAMRASTRHDQPLAELINLDPPVNVIWRLRLRRYLLQLAESWDRASRSDHVVLFDQAYVQFACSMMLLGRKGIDDDFAQKLVHAIPKSDLLVAVNAPRAILTERLQSRLRSQGVLERCLEFDLKTNLASIVAAEKLEAALRQIGRPMVNISSVDQASAKMGLTVVALKLRVGHSSSPPLQADSRG